MVSLKEIFPIIRNDAKIIINHNQSNFNSSEILLVGNVEQFFINLDPKEYQASFNSIKSGHIHNLAISTSFITQRNARMEERLPLSLGMPRSTTRNWISVSTLSIFNFLKWYVMCQLSTLVAGSPSKPCRKGSAKYSTPLVSLQLQPIWNHSSRAKTKKKNSLNFVPYTMMEVGLFWSKNSIDPSNTYWHSMLTIIIHIDFG